MALSDFFGERFDVRDLTMPGQFKRTRSCETLSLGCMAMPWGNHGEMKGRALAGGKAGGLGRGQSWRQSKLCTDGVLGKAVWKVPRCFLGQTNNNVVKQLGNTTLGLEGTQFVCFFLPHCWNVKHIFVVKPQYTIPLNARVMIGFPTCLLFVYFDHHRDMMKC
jgi:hypothetical protein